MTEQQSTALTTAQEAAWTREKIDLLKRTLCKDATDDEMEMFLHFVKKSGLDPFAGQVYAIKRKGVLKIQCGIDSFRLVAQRSGEYEGQIGPLWCGPDGKWLDVWLNKEPPLAAKVGVWRRGFREPITAIARWNDYVQFDRDGNVAQFWRKMAPLMLGKCAEALALRRSFPMELSGMYVQEEMDQATKADEKPDMPSAEAIKLEELRQQAFCEGWHDLPAPAEVAGAGKLWHECTREECYAWLKLVGTGTKEPVAWTVDEVRAMKQVEIAGNREQKRQQPKDAEIVQSPPVAPAPSLLDQAFPKEWHIRPCNLGPRPDLTWEQMATQQPAVLARIASEAKKLKGRPSKSDLRGWTEDEIRSLVALNKFNSGYIQGGMES